MNLISSPTRILLALSAIKGVGPAALKKVSNIPMFWGRALEDWAAAAPQISRAIENGADNVWQVAQRWADEQVAAAEKNRARILSAVDAEYPRLLAATKDDPFLLFVKGNLALEPQQSVAIIGTREPTQHGVMIAQRITQFFVEQHWSVVSGLALGCDSIAHQAALDAGGHTVAVMAHGLQMVAPSRHKKLAHDILDAGGALVSEYPFGRDAAGSQFVKRDRTQAGMARGVVMIQSDIKGGSLHASRAAIDYQRWLAVPYPTDRDRENAEPKVQANLVIADGTNAQRADLLRCPMSALRLVEVVRGRADYLKLIGQEAVEPSDAAPASTTIVSDELSLQEDFGPEPASAASVAELAKPTPVESSTPVRAPLPEAPQAESSDRPSLLELSGATFGASLEEVPVTVDEPPPAETSTGGPLYYLEVGPEDLASLKSSKLPTENKSEQASEVSRSDVNFALTLSRIGHIQIKLDDLRKVRSKRPLDDQRAALVLFQIEDALTHMKRVADYLAGLDRGAHREVALSVLVKRGGASRQPDLPMMSAAAKPLAAPLLAVLDQLVNALPRSVSVHGRKVMPDDVNVEQAVEVHLSDLLFSFDYLVRAVLPQGSYASTTELDRKT